MPRRIPPPTGIALTTLRSAQGWSQIDLAAAAATPRNLISDFEKGRRNLSREKLGYLAALMGYDAETIDLALAFLPLAGAGGSPDAAESRSPVDASAAEQRRVGTAASSVALAVAEAAGSCISDAMRARHAEHDRRTTDRLWRDLAPLHPAARRRRVESSKEFQHWALSDRLCAESLKAAGRSADQAFDLANLALRVADLSPGAAPWRNQLKGRALLFVANARRVGGDLSSADRFFATGLQLWQMGGDNPRNPLAQWQVLDLEATLRIGQRRWAESLNLLDRTLTLAPREMVGHVLLSVSSTLQRSGDVAGSVATLHEAEPLISKGADSRLRFAWGFQMVLNLWNLGSCGEAETYLAPLRDFASELGNDLDALRVHWLAARVAAGLGRHVEAYRLLCQARQGFAERNIPYDVALAAAELAALQSSKSSSTDRLQTDAIEKPRAPGKSDAADAQQLAHQVLVSLSSHAATGAFRRKRVSPKRAATAPAAIPRAVRQGPCSADAHPADLRVLVVFLRALRDCSQTAMAEAAGIDRSTLSHYETGRRIPSRDVVERLARASGLSVSFVHTVLLPAIHATGMAATAAKSDAGTLTDCDTSRFEKSVSSLARAAAATVLSEV
jgi:transcriptional regulator with XRE-family HTH domain